MLAARGLGVRVAVGVLAAGVVAGTVGALILRSTSERALREEIEEVHRGVADRRAAELDGRVDGLLRSLRLASTRSELQGLESASEELAVALHAAGDFDRMVLYRRDGTPVAAASERTVLDAAELPPRPDLSDAVTEDGSDDDAFDDRSSVSLSRDGFPTVEVAVAVENPPGSLVGVLAGSVPLEILVGSLRVSYLGDSARTLLVGRDGVVLVAPERDRVLEERRYPVEEVLAGEGRAAVLEEEGGGDVLATASRPRLLPVDLVVAVDESEAFARVGDEVRDRTLLLLAVVGGMVLAALAVTSWLLRPLRGLARAVRRIGEGDSSVRAAARGSTEIRSVAAEVNRMVDALEDRLEEVRDAEERFRTAFQEAPVAMALTTVEGEYEQVNPAMCELLDRGERDLVGRHWRDITHPDDLETGYRAVEEARRERRPGYQLEKRYLRADGTPIWVLLNVAFAGGPEHPRHLIIHFIDLTERVEAERRLQQVLEGAPDAVVVVADDGRIELVNRQVSALFGYEPGELLGEPVEQLVPARSRDLHTMHRGRYMEAPTLRPMGQGLELTGRREDGSEFPVEISLSPIDTKAGRRIVATVRDITERRQAEETARSLQEMRARQRQAIEVNDNVVQGLTIAKWSFEVQRHAAAEEAVERTLVAARELVDRMLAEGSPEGVSPGDLVRERPAEFGS